MTETRYPFESSHTSTHRSRKEAEAMLAIFLRRLTPEGQTPPSELAADVRRALLRFVSEIHGNIVWYQRHQRREHRVWYAYFFVSLAILTAAPLGILYIADTKSSADTIPQLTAAFAGLIAFQRAAGAWLDRRKRMALFHRSGAELKELLYTFEETWHGLLPTDDSSQEAFIKAITSEVRQARQIVKNERQSFFDLLEKDKYELDIGTGLSKTARDVGGIVRGFVPKSIETAQKVQSDFKEQQAEVAALRDQVKRLEIGIDDARKEDRGEDVRPLQARLRSTVTRLERAEIELAKLTAQLGLFE